MQIKKSQRIFLDNNSTTPRDPRVLDVFIQTEKKFYGNSSSNHIFGWEAQEVVKLAQEQLSRLVDADPECVIFTSGATEANCLAILGFEESLAKTNNQATFVTSKLEHRAVLEPFLKVMQKGRPVFYFDNDSMGRVDFQSKKVMTEKPNFISLQLANNEIGTIQSVSGLAKYFPDAFLHSDAAQAAGKIDFSIGELAVDCLTISAHKMYGPVGIGALIFKNYKSMKKVCPQIIGGNQQGGIRSGTIPVSLIAAFGEAARIAKSELDDNKKHLFFLTKIFFEELRQNFSDVLLLGEQDFKKRLPGNLSLRLIGVDADKLTANLATKIAFSTGSACQSSVGKVSHVLSAIGQNEVEIKQTIRIGFGKQNTEEEAIFAAREIAKQGTGMLLVA